MDRQALTRRLMTTFLGELDEHVQALNRDLLALEAAQPDARAELLQTLFRTAHSLKGAARAVGLDLIETACHHLETILGAARQDARAFGPDLFQLLFATADGIQDAGRRLRDEAGLEGGSLPSLLQRLAAAAGVDSATASPPPSAPPVPAAAAPPATDDRRVRISADALDALLTRTGELRVIAGRMLERTRELEVLRDSIARSRRQQRQAERMSRRSNNGAGVAAVVPSQGRPDGYPLGQVLQHIDAEAERIVATAGADARLLAQACAALDGEVRQARMVPFIEACETLARTARDLAKAGGKDIQLEIRGGDVQVDRAIVEGLKDPLLHLVRNAADHGIERPDDRRRAGKRSRGSIVVSAEVRGSIVEVAVSDDGRGLQMEAVGEQARARGLPEPATPAEAAALIFAPGFTTARTVSSVSGRGVGLDIVKSRVEALRGTVELSFQPGQGTRFVLLLPLTLTTIRALLVEVREQLFALPATNVRRLLRVDPEDVRSVEGRDVVMVDSRSVPLASLAEAAGIPAGAETLPRVSKVPAAVVAAAGQQVAFLVDELVAEQDVLVKSLGPRLAGLRHVSGATILPSGRMAFILNPSEVVNHALGRSPGAALVRREEDTRPVRKRLLVVDDSVTTRTLERSILEAAGYDVAVAVDGAEAWRLLQEQGADLIVSDVEMPNLDGFALTEAVRASQRFRAVPVVLVTALGSERDRARGMEVGADAYVVKSAFDQKGLLDVIAQLL